MRKQAVEPADTTTVDKRALPSTFRAGYSTSLRTADTPELLALALPGLAGIMALTAAGGLIGYRQAKAGHALLAAGSARFLH